MSVLGPKLADVRTQLPGCGVGRQHGRNEARPGRERLRCRRSVWRVHPTRHGGGSCLARSPPRDCRLTGLFADHPKPTAPHDLLQHSCINYRHGSGEVYHWELDKGDQSVVVAVNGPLITNDIGLLTRAALDGVGLAFMSKSKPLRISRPAHWSGCWRIGARRFLGSSCLPEPAPAPSRTHRTHRDAARLRRTSYGLDLQPRSILEKPVSDRGTLGGLTQFAVSRA